MRFFEVICSVYACLQPSCYKTEMMAHCQEKVSWADIDMMAAEKSRVGRGREKKNFMAPVARSHD